MLPHPGIFLIDIDDDARALIEKKWNISGAGSLGAPYKVNAASSWQQVVQPESIKGHEESDILIVDLNAYDLLYGPVGHPHIPEREVDLWAKCDSGWIDSRVRSALAVQSDIDTILDNGGVLIVFAGPDSPMGFMMGKSVGRGIETVQDIVGGVWNLSSDLRRLRPKSKSGSHIQVESNSKMGSLLKKHASNSTYLCTFDSMYQNDKSFYPLAVNKYGNTIAGCYNRGNRTIYLFPNLSNKAAFLDELISEVLPEIFPALYPGIERGLWTHQPEYELENVKNLSADKKSLIDEMQKAVDGIDNLIREERAKDSWIHSLLTSSGDELVIAVQKALTELGFQKIVDVDALRDASGQSRREDLRIEDRSPLLIIDIKGIGGKASDEDVMQASKHAAINMRELNRVDIRSLSIVNQQRHLPPLDRDNASPFRDDLITYALESSIGLMTTFDLYRLVLNKRKNNWPIESLYPAFYTDGRVSVVPGHYNFIGFINKVFTGRFGLQILQGQAKVGDVMVIETDILFYESSIEKLEANGVPVNEGFAGDKIGFQWSNPDLKLKEGLKVFIIPTK